jgi:hypothetical protein
MIMIQLVFLLTSLLGLTALVAAYRGEQNRPRFPLSVPYAHSSPDEVRAGLKRFVLYGSAKGPQPFANNSILHI